MGAGGGPSDAIHPTEGPGGGLEQNKQPPAEPKTAWPKRAKSPRTPGPKILSGVGGAVEKSPASPGDGGAGGRRPGTRACYTASWNGAPGTRTGSSHGKTRVERDQAGGGGRGGDKGPPGRPRPGGLALGDPLPGGEGGVTAGEALLEPAAICVRDLLLRLAALEGGGAVKGAVHVTGGGFQENIPRVLPDGLGATVARGAWEVSSGFCCGFCLGPLGGALRPQGLVLGFRFLADPQRVRWTSRAPAAGARGVPVAAGGRGGGGTGDVPDVQHGRRDDPRRGPGGRARRARRPPGRLRARRRRPRRGRHVRVSPSRARRNLCDSFGRGRALEGPAVTLLPCTRNVI